MQSIDDEIPDLSGPISLGTYKFTRRARSKKYDTHKLSELQETQEQKGKNKVTESATTSSAHAPFNLPPPTTLPSFQLPEHPTPQFVVKLDDSIPNRLANPSPDRRGFHEPSPPHYGELDSSHYAANIPNSVRSIYTDRQNSQASGQASSSFPPARDQRPIQGPNSLINPDTSSSRTSGKVHPSFTPESHISNQHFSDTVNLNRQTLQPASRHSDKSFPLQDHRSNQNFNVSINTDRRSSQASGQVHPLVLPPERQSDTSQQYNELAKSFNALIKIDRRSSKGSGQASSPFPPQDFQRHTSQPHRKIESKVNDLLDAHRQSSQASRKARNSVSPKANSSTQSLPLSGTLPTAAFNLKTNQWDPDLPEKDMSAHTPTNKATRGGHSGLQSSRQSSSRMSYGSQDARNPHAIITTTKSGRPYTNPYMPIDPPPSAARQTVRESPSGHVNPDIQYDDPNPMQLQHNMRYIDQEEARYRALEQAKYGLAEESLDDPFQDQATCVHYEDNQSATYIEQAAQKAAQQAAYGIELPGYGHPPTFSTYASEPGASSFPSDARQATHALNPEMSLYHGQRSAYEQQSATNPRASVRLPAVRGTRDQQKVVLQEPKFEILSLEDSAGNNDHDQRHHRKQGGFQPAPGRASHAVPIRDPAAYTGSGLTTRRNQEVLRQNLDNVVASSQGPAGSARTVMNDPHRDRRPSGRPSSTVTDTTVVGSRLRAQAPSYESATAQRTVTTNPAFMKPGPDTSHRQGREAPVESGLLILQHRAGNTLKRPERTTTDAEVVKFGESLRAPAIPPGFDHDAATYTKNAGLPAAAIGAGNAFMDEIAKRAQPSKRNPQQRLEDAATWFRTDPRDLSYPAAILPLETMNRMNPDQFPLINTAPSTVGQLADDSQDDDPNDQARQAATPRPIGHGRPAGFTTPPSNDESKRAATQAPFSTLTNVASVNDKEGMERSGREFLDNDRQAIEAMIGGVFSNLMTAKNGPYDYTNHYAPPPAYAIDHNAKNNDTFFDPQWFATAPPARVGRDPRREQGEYEDPTQGSAGRRADHARGEAGRRGSGGFGGSGGRAWGRI